MRCVRELSETKCSEALSAGTAGAQHLPCEPGDVKSSGAGAEPCSNIPAAALLAPGLKSVFLYACTCAVAQPAEIFPGKEYIGSY